MRDVKMGAYLEEGVSHDFDKAGLSVAAEPVSWVLVQEACSVKMNCPIVWH